MSHVQQGKQAQNFSLQGFLYKNFYFMFHVCNLVHLISMELVPCKLLIMLTIFKIFYRMFEMVRECTHKEGGLGL